MHLSGGDYFRKIPVMEKQIIKSRRENNMERLGSNYTSDVVRMNVKILRSERDEFKEICEKNDSTVSDMVRFLIEEYTKHMHGQSSHFSSFSTSP